MLTGDNVQTAAAIFALGLEAFQRKNLSGEYQSKTIKIAIKAVPRACYKVPPSPQNKFIAWLIRAFLF